MDNCHKAFVKSGEDETTLLVEVGQCLQDADRLLSRVIRSYEAGLSEEIDFTLAALCGVAAGLATNIVMIERIKALPIEHKALIDS